jgi:ectoine hydroxylase-related dioxygenase (phytanoyl-CoA dioxygenase family)
MTRSDITLPPLTDDVDRAIEHLHEAGCCRLSGLIEGSQLTELRRLVHERAARERRDGNDYCYSDGVHQRVWMLVDRGAPFLALAADATARRVVAAVLGPDALLSNLSANITGPGGSAMAPHWDQDWAPRPWPHALVAHVIYMLDDFTIDNGATVVAPGSHRTDKPAAQVALVPATGPAGTALVIDGRLWHGTGLNRSTGTRSGLLTYYCRPFVRQQENFALSLTPAVRAELTEPQRSLLGLEFYEYLNMVGGPPRSLPRY